MGRSHQQQIITTIIPSTAAATATAILAALPTNENDDWPPDLRYHSNIIHTLILSLHYSRANSSDTITGSSIHISIIITTTAEWLPPNNATTKSPDGWWWWWSWWWWLGGRKKESGNYGCCRRRGSSSSGANQPVFKANFKTAYSVWLLRNSPGDYHWYVSTCQTFNLRLQTKVLTAYSTLITFPTHHFYNLTQPLENTTHIADQWPNAKQCVFLFILSYRCACRQPIQYREMIIMANRKKSSSSNRISRC